MALHLIHGPLNSGRTGLLLDRVRAVSRDNPVVLAPTGESRFALERELCPAGSALLGPTVTTMRGLAEEAAKVTATEIPPRATAGQRRALLLGAITDADLRILERSAAGAGFAAECERQFTRLRADGVEPERRPDGDDDRDPYLDELMGLYADYLGRLEQAGRGDAPALVHSVTAALKADPEAWGRRPVFLHGFDSLTLGEIELLEALSRSAEVTVSITHEPAREALAARATLYERMRDLEPASETATEATRAFTGSDLLFHIERHFGEPDPPKHHDDGSVRLLRSAGRRGEAGTIATEVRKLIAAGVPASEIAVATLDTDSTGRALERAFEAAGVPVALEAEISVARTAIGTLIGTLLQAAFTDRGPAAVMRHLRAGGYRPEIVDEVERRLARERDPSREQAVRLYAELADEPASWLSRLEAARGDGSGAAELIADIVLEAAGDLDSELELRAAGAINLAARELADLGKATPRPRALVRLLGDLRVLAWQGPSGERVRIASPYTLRAGRFGHLFVASLQDGEFPRTGRVDPFLSEEQRRGLRLPEEPDPEHEDIYLFHVCLSRPTDGLWLSTRVADEEGKPGQPSPLLEMVTEMIEGADDALPGVVVERDLGAVVPPPREATSTTELARAAVATLDPAVLGEAGLPDELAAEIATEMMRVVSRERASRRPRPLRDPTVLAELSLRAAFGATTIEAFTAHPFHWFIHHELKPEALAPDDDQLIDGSIVHAALEKLYRDQPGGTSKPRPESLSAWKRQATDLIVEISRRAGLSQAVPADVARRRLIELCVESFLECEAAEEIEVDPGMLEAAFGEEEDCDRPSLDFGGWKLHGKIDRVDLTPDSRAGLIRDYKFSANATAVKDFAAEGRLQLQLYLIALRELWGIEPLGGLYVPLKARGKKPRGLLLDSSFDPWLEGLECVKTDRISEEAMEEALEAGRRTATETVAALRAGQIDRDPLEGAHTDVRRWSAIDRRPRKALEEAGR